MACRRRAQLMEYNRRRRLILDKGFDLIHNQKDTNFGECLLKWNVKEKDKLQMQLHKIHRQGEIDIQHKEQEKRHFVILRDQSTREPTVILERHPHPENYADYVDPRVPRYMRHLESKQNAPPAFPILCAYQAEKKQKRNLWEAPPDSGGLQDHSSSSMTSTGDSETDSSATSGVAFRSCLGMRTPSLSASERHALLQEWRGLKDVYDLRPYTADGGGRNRFLPTPLRHAVGDVAKNYCEALIPPSTPASTDNESIFITQMGSEQYNRHYGKPIRKTRPSVSRPWTSSSTASSTRRRAKREKQVQKQQAIDNAFAEIYHVMKDNTARGVLSFAAENPTIKGPRTPPFGSTEIIQLETKCRTAESARILASVQRKRTAEPKLRKPDD